MIDIQMKMYFTKELNEITVAYARNVVLKKLFNKLVFDSYEGYASSEKLEISDLIFQIAYYNEPFDLLDPGIAIEIIGLVSKFTESLDKKDLTALYFLIFNAEQDRYLADFEANDYNETKEQDLSEQFGRYIARTIYNPEGSFLYKDLQIYLQNQVLSFAEDFGHTELDNDTIDQALETLDLYTNEMRLSYQMK